MKWELKLGIDVEIYLWLYYKSHAYTNKKHPNFEIYRFAYSIDSTPTCNFIFGHSNPQILLQLAWIDSKLRGTKCIGRLFWNGILLLDYVIEFLMCTGVVGAQPRDFG